MANASLASPLLSRVGLRSALPPAALASVLVVCCRDGRFQPFGSRGVWLELTCICPSILPADLPPEFRSLRPTLMPDVTAQMPARAGAPISKSCNNDWSICLRTLVRCWKGTKRRLKAAMADDSATSEGVTHVRQKQQDNLFNLKLHKQLHKPSIRRVVQCGLQWGLSSAKGRPPALARLSSVCAGQNPLHVLHDRELQAPFQPGFGAPSCKATRPARPPQKKRAKCRRST